MVIGRKAPKAGTYTERLHALMQGRPNRLNQTEVDEIATAVTCIANHEPSERTATVPRTLSRA
jgi:hypothetical protein